MMAKTVFTLALLSVSQVFMTCAKPWGSDSHEDFFGSVGTFRLPIVASAFAVPVARSSAVAAPAPAPAAPAPAAPAPAQAPSSGVSRVGFAFAADDSREFGYDGSNEVRLFAFGANKNQVW
ncbi:uncharacterized protein LOC135214617 [Macrobrachium nipponense]|uniref:uncharacterized protein LOC135214617 n=1 Tax=Macrobrachium nipponense TaxID=159736 RepID=UPI0030C82413